jgi:hypothetical protein
MNRYRIKFHTGPTQVERFAIKVAASDLIDPKTVILGTEHVYFDCEGTDITDATIVAQRVLGETRGITVQPIITR